MRNDMNRRWLLNSRPKGPLQPDTFKWDEVPIPPVSEGEFLVRNLWLSFDPGDLAGRAALQSLGGLIVNDAVEALYPTTTEDADGNHLSARHKYRLRFPPGQLPPVNAF